MSRFAALLLLVFTSACMMSSEAVEPKADPALAVFHGRSVVTHSGPRSDGDLRVSCGSGIQRRGQFFAIDNGYPAPFAAAIAGDFKPHAMQVIVFGGTIADTSPGARVRSDLIGGRHAEVATLVLENEETEPVLGFSVIPMDLMTATPTVMIEAAAVDAGGQELRTGYPVVGTASALCRLS